MTDNSKSMMCNEHFVLSRNKEPEQSISFLTGSILGSNGKPLINKGIKVPAGEIFHYCKPEEDYDIYIFEAGLGPGLAETVTEDIYIYITCNEKRLLVGTLSSKHSTIQLNLMMAEDFQLTHTSKRKTIFFNACRFSPMPLAYCLRHRNTDKEFWVMELKLLKEAMFNPVDDAEKYHILSV